MILCGLCPKTRVLKKIFIEKLKLQKYELFKIFKSLILKFIKLR